MADPTIKQVRLITGFKSNSVEEGDEDLHPIPDESGGGTRKRAKRGGGRRPSNKTYKVGVVTKEGGSAPNSEMPTLPSIPPPIKGGGSTSPGTLTQLSASHVPGASPPGPEPVGVNSTLTQKGSPMGGGSGTSSTPSVKVVLAAPKKKKGAVVLAAAAPKQIHPPTTHTAKTRKSARKIKVSMKSLSKKIHRAKTIRHKATEDTLDTIKRALHKAGLVKLDSKAPEPILRQMYADFMTLKNRAL